jgi:Glycosyltransferase family 87
VAGLGQAKSWRSFVITVVCYLFIVQLALLYFYVPIALRGRTDFRHLYIAGYMVRSGNAHQLFDYDAGGQFQNTLVSSSVWTLPFNHLAYEALFFAPFSLLPFRSAYLGFFCLNLVLLFICYRLLRSYLVGMAQIWPWLPRALFTCFLPVTAALIQGQDSIILLTLMTAAFVSLEKGHPLQAGIFVGLTLFKFQFTIPMLLLFLAWKWWRAAAGCVAAGAVVGLLSVWVTGVAEFRLYAHSLVSMSAGLKTHAQQERYGIYPEVMPNLRGFLSTMIGQASNGWAQAITILCSCLVLFLAVRRRPSFSIAIGVAVLVSYHAVIHDAALLIIPIASLVVAALETRFASSRSAICLAAAVFVTPTVLMVAGGHFYLLAPIVLAMLLVVNSDKTVPGGERPVYKPLILSPNESRQIGDCSQEVTP